MRERGTQSRRARLTEPEAGRRPPPPQRTAGFWPALAIAAIVAATAGWTAAGILALRPPAAASAEPTDDLSGLASEEPGVSLEPIEDSHAFPALEAVLPAAVNGTPLTSQSWPGDTLVADDPWSATLTKFLTGVGKTPTDISFAQAYDASEAGGLDVTAGVFQLAGVDPAALRDAIIEAWKGDYADLVVSEITLGGMPVTKGDFGEGQINSYWYVRDGLVFDIGSADEALAAAALAALPVAGAPAPSAVPSVSAAPS